MAEEFKRNVIAHTNNAERILEGWQPPPRGFYKLNMDGSYTATSSTASLGAVVRDADEQVCLTAVTRSEEVVSSFQAEIKAILFGLQLINEQHVKDLLVESDCLMAIKEIESKEESLSEWVASLRIFKKGH